MFWSLSMFGLDNGMSELYLKRATKQGKGRGRRSLKHTAATKGMRHKSLRIRGNRAKARVRAKAK